MFLFGKKKNRETTITDQGGKKGGAGSNHIQSAKTSKNRSYFFRVEDVFTIKGRGVVVVGMVHGGEMMVNDHIDLVKLDGTRVPTMIGGIERYKVGEVDQAENGENVGVLLKGWNADQLCKGIVLDYHHAYQEEDQRADQEAARQKEQQREEEKKEAANADMSQEEKDRIGKQFLLNNTIPKVEDLEELKLQNLSFLMTSAVYFHEKKAFGEDNFMEKVPIFKEAYIEKIKKADKLYALIDPKTTHPYIDNQSAIWMFSTLQLAEMAQKHYEKDDLVLEIKTIPQDENTQWFAQLYYDGMEEIKMDMGAYVTMVKRAEILPPPDWSQTPKISVPIVNPHLNRHLLQYLQLAYRKKTGAAVEKAEITLINWIIGDIAQATFLCPVKYETPDGSKPEADQDGNLTLKSGATIQFACVTSSDGVNAYPVFTDWRMFRKMFDDKEWGGQIFTYQDVLSIAKDDIIVVNPGGIEFHIKEQLREPLQKACDFFKNRKEEQEKGNSEEK